MRTLLVLDIDKTLCDSRATDKYLPTNGDFTRWHKETARRNHPVVRGSKAGVRKLLQTPELIGVVIITSRNDNMAADTSSWIERHFPLLATAEMSMRTATDRSPAVESKKIRLAKLKKKYKAQRVIVVDDEPWAYELASGKKDEFIHIKNCNWSNKK
jgi:hypothetical protein